MPTALWLLTLVGSIQAHRILILGLNLLGDVLLASAVRNFSRAGLIQLGANSLVPRPVGSLARRFPEG